MSFLCLNGSSLDDYGLGSSADHLGPNNLEKEITFKIIFPYLRHFKAV
jgi:hypothetical protein